MRFTVLVGLLALADAKFLHDKRGVFVSVDEFTLKMFWYQFKQNLLHIVGSSINDTKADIEQLKVDMAECKQKLEDKKASCKDCAGDECAPSIGEIIEGYVLEALDPVKKFGVETIGGWEGWVEMEDFFTGIGHGFLEWGGWGDMEDFFGGLADGFIEWDGWDDLADIGEDIIDGLGKFDLDDLNPFNWGRKKRAIDRLSTLYRALAYLYSREIDPETRECMEPCADCQPFLKEQYEMIEDVCGSELLAFNATVTARVKLLEMVYKFALDEDEKVVIDFQYDSSKYVPTIPGFAPTKLTARFENGYETYETSEAYRFSGIQTTAALMAYDYWLRIQE